MVARNNLAGSHGLVLAYARAVSFRKNRKKLFFFTDTKKTKMLMKAIRLTTVVNRRKD